MERLLTAVQVAAPRVFDRAALLVDLWKLKLFKAQGRSFHATRDLHLATLDMISSVAFGMEASKAALNQELSHTRCFELDTYHASDEPANFPTPRTDPEIESLLNIPRGGCHRAKQPLSGTSSMAGVTPAAACPSTLAEAGSPAAADGEKLAKACLVRRRGCTGECVGPAAVARENSSEEDGTGGRLLLSCDSGRGKWPSL